MRLSVGFLLPISLSVILCGWLKGISNENLYRILRSIVPCTVSIRLPFNRSRLWGGYWRGVAPPYLLIEYAHRCIILCHYV